MLASFGQNPNLTDLERQQQRLTMNEELKVGENPHQQLMRQGSYEFYKSAKGGSSDSSPRNSEKEESKVHMQQVQIMQESPDDLQEEADDDMDEDLNSCASSVIVPYSRAQIQSNELNDIQRQMLKKESAE